MRVPDLNKLKKIKVNKDIFIVKEYDSEYDKPERLKYNMDMEEKAKIKFVKIIEKLVRSSIEYRDYISFLRDHFDMNQCAYYNNIDNKDTYRVKIEVHHSPFTLYDIAYIILNKHFAMYGNNINLSSIVYEILEIHYKGIVGLIPLNKTIHDLTHNGYLFIPISYVFGNVEQFYQEYFNYMTEQQKELYEKNCNVDNETQVIPDFLKKSLVYIRQDEFQIPKNI